MSDDTESRIRDLVRDYDACQLAKLLVESENQVNDLKNGFMGIQEFLAAPGETKMQFTGVATQILADFMMLFWLGAFPTPESEKKLGGNNIEMTVGIERPGFDMEPFIITMQRKAGKTPVEQRREVAEELTALLQEAYECLCDGIPKECSCAKQGADGELVVKPYSGECIYCRIRLALAQYATPHTGDTEGAAV